jgi:flagellar basal-body rod protein FlgB
MILSAMFNNSGTAPLDRVIQFTENRHKILVNNLANIDTPGYVMQDLNVNKFQQDLKNAIERKTLSNESSAEPANAKTDHNQYLLFHDQNNRSVEKQVSQITENTVAHNVAVELLRSRYGLLEKAIALRA